MKPATEQLDIQETNRLYRSTSDTMSVVHCSRGPIILAKLDSQLYVPSVCLSSLAKLHGDSAVDFVEEIGFELRGKISIPANSEEYARFRAQLASKECYVEATKDICLIPIKTAIRILLGLLREDVRIIEEFRILEEGLAEQ